MRSILTPQALLHLASDMGLTDEQRAKFEAFVRGVGLLDERVTYAMHLFDIGDQRPTVDSRLMDRFGVSSRTASRLSAEALNLRQKTAMEMAEKRFIVKTD